MISAGSTRGSGKDGSFMSSSADGTSSPGSTVEAGAVVDVEGASVVVGSTVSAVVLSPAPQAETKSAKPAAMERVVLRTPRETWRSAPSFIECRRSDTVLSRRRDECHRCDHLCIAATIAWFARAMTKSAPKRRSRGSRGLALSAVVLIALVVGAIVWTAGSDDSPEPADPAPEVTLEFFEGSSQQLSDLRGKPVVLNFWASWCPACISEMPAFGEVHRRFGDEVEFIGVNMQEVDLDAAMDLVEQTGVDYRLVHDVDGSIYNAFGGIAMPTTVFISADGSVELTHSGAMFEEELTETIRSELLG